MIDNNPCADAARISVAASDDFDISSPVDVEAVVRTCDAVREVAILSVAFYAGLRLGEIRELRWRDVDWTKRMKFAHRTAEASHASRATRRCSAC